MTSLGCDVQRRLASAREWIHGGAPRHQGSRGGRVPELGSVVQGRPAVRSGPVGIRTGVEQRLDDRDVSGPGGLVERRHADRVRGRQVRAFLDQRADRRRIAQARSQGQGPQLARTRGLEVVAGRHGCSHGVDVTAPDGGVQALLAPRRFEAADESDHEQQRAGQRLAGGGVHARAAAPTRGARGHQSSRTRERIASWTWALLATTCDPSRGGGAPSMPVTRPPASSTIRLPAATSQAWSLSSQ